MIDSPENGQNGGLGHPVLRPIVDAIITMTNSQIGCIMTGVVLTISVQYLLLPLVAKFASTRLSASNVEGRGRDAAIYGLEHGRLNIMLPSLPMWMNMGFWRDTNEFPTASKALVLELLARAGLLDDGSSSGSPHHQTRLRPSPENEDDTLRILDLGFGCGDQTLCLLELARATKVPLRYVGITINEAQFELAQQRLNRAMEEGGEERDGVKEVGGRESGGKHNIRLFHADAAQPSSWTPDLAEAVKGPVSDMDDNKADGGGGTNGHQTYWVMALDTLYHFRPSRAPILSYAAGSLGASFMAFDLLMADDISLSQRMRLRLAAMAAGCPSTAFIPEKQYRAMLAGAGYDPGAIEITDITEHVFGPLSRFMERQEGDLGRIGLKMGKLQAASWLFKWWARSGVVRAVFVVAWR